MNRKTFLTSIAAALLAVAPLAQTGAANGPVAVAGTNFTINIVDPDPSNGFSDDTVASDPAPGNPGNTVGEQRLEAYKEAARIWQTVLDVDVPIVVQASFLSLFCDEDSAVLGAAGANQVFRDFPGPSFPLTWYGAALANELSGFDLGGTTPDPGLISPPFNDEIVSFFNSDLGQTGCLENSSWYYGLDHNNPADSIDFLAVLLHEVAHGLGFQNFVNEASGQHLLGHPDQWSRFEADNVLGGKHWNQMLDIERAISATNGPNLVWDGPAVTAEAPNVLGPAQGIVVNAP
ncbi:MAG: peptidase, partial [Gammaproteobacteria bacterium]|nr:peptidase [Gammaproteobacteria bacterium]